MVGEENWTECWEKEDGERDIMEPPETDAGNLTSEPQPRGDIQINRDGLIWDTSLANKKLELMGQAVI